MALGDGSPAIDSGGQNSTCASTDQRGGVTRPQGSACDMGAYEVEADSTPTVTPTDTPTNTPTPTITPTDTLTPTPARFGWTPGLWKNHQGLWPAPYTIGIRIVDVFSAASIYPNSIKNATLLKALGFTG